MPRTCISFPLAFLLTVLLLAAAPARGQNRDKPVGSVEAATGIVTVQHNGRRSKVAAHEPVFLHEVFTTRRASSVKLILSGGSELDIGERSSVTIERQLLNAGNDARSSVVALLAGKLRAIVPFASGRTNFSLRTGNALCGVRGTEFEVAYIVGRPCPGFPKCLRYTDVGVVHGVVEVRSLTNRRARPVKVAAGYETTVPCEIPPSSPSPLGASELELPGYH